MSDTAIELKLNSAGFTGAEVDELLPRFMTERRVTVGLTWWPSADGPESWTLLVVTGVAAGTFLKKVAEKLADDLYEWTKTKLATVLARKRHPLGFVTFVFEDVRVTYEVLPTKEEDLVALCGDLPILLRQVDPAQGANWSVERAKSGEWIVLVDGTE